MSTEIQTEKITENEKSLLKTLETAKVRFEKQAKWLNAYFKKNFTTYIPKSDDIIDIISEVRARNPFNMSKINRGLYNTLVFATYQYLAIDEEINRFWKSIS